MTNIVKKSLSIIWIIYGILGVFLVFLSNIFSINEETFVYISILFGILGIILLIISKYNKPQKKKVSFEDEFKEDLANLTESFSEENSTINDTTLNDTNVNSTTNDTNVQNLLSQITNDANKTLEEHKNNSDPELSTNQSIPIYEAFNTSSNNGLYI